MWSRELPYHCDSASLFDAIADWPWAVFLDSSHRHAERGRYDIITARPRITLTSWGDTTLVQGEAREQCLRENPFEVLRRELRRAAPEGGGALFPFSGGALGYFGYGLTHPSGDLVRREGPAGMPDMAVGVYDWAVVVDHEARRVRLVGQGDREPRWLLERFTRSSAPASRPPMRPLGAIRSNLTPLEYKHAFRRIQTYIRDGDCYQVNFAQRFEVDVGGHPWSAYRRLRRLTPAPFGAYLNLPQGQILSLSPERFLHVRQGRVETRPIKGTRPRSAHGAHDEALRNELAASAKDRAENVMIVDLLRNDLGKSCRLGSVAVSELFSVESFATVHHLVSAVTGCLAQGRDALHLLEAAFPGGSITGAPKRRAMEIIKELEPDPRGVYCGAIGYIGFDGTMDTNIAIRTFVHQSGRLRFWAGGGIVHDSYAQREYQETLDKAAALFRMFERSGD